MGAWRLKMEPHRLKMGPQRLKMEPWRLKNKTELWTVFRPVVADSLHFDEEQDPHPNMYYKKAGSGSELTCGSATI
jgi:hypothetical protein